MFLSVSEMSVLGVDLLDCPLVQIFLSPLVIGGLAIITLLKFYAHVTCGRCSSKAEMNGKTVIITGANGGIGKETARDLAKRGARVILACRNVDSGNQTRDEIVETTKNQNVTVKKLDLSSQKSIREFAKDINETESKLHVLIHNAGTAESRTKVTEDGLELTMATNHFGPFLLTHLLIDLLKKSAPSRIVVASSVVYHFAFLNLNKLNPFNSYCPLYLYFISKYANVSFTLELARRLEGTRVTANCLHPGLIDTGIWRNVPIPLNWPLKLIVKSFFKTPVQGCQTSVYVAVDEGLEDVTGKYFVDCKERSLSRGVMDTAKAKKLWELCEKFANLQETDPKI